MWWRKNKNNAIIQIPSVILKFTADLGGTNIQCVTKIVRYRLLSRFRKYLTPPRMNYLYKKSNQSKNGVLVCRCPFPHFPVPKVFKGFYAPLRVVNVFFFYTVTSFLLKQRSNHDATYCYFNGKSSDEPQSLIPSVQTITAKMHS